MTGRLFEGSRYFILLASPQAAASPWVNKEVAHWLERKSLDTLLIGLTEGELSWDATPPDEIDNLNLATERNVPANLSAHLPIHPET